ncbi:MAG: dephospho-CoA kinase [Elusimicrobia bacterium]|nr:dephospho-CoA kinase [Elusimicrobiota bacterium]
MKPKRFVVGLTGGIGTGKSTALAEFEKAGASTLSLDQIAREQARPGGDAYKAIVKAFGLEVLEKGSRRIDRRKLGAKVFRSKAARTKLERVTHPLILKEARRLISRLQGVVVVDVPLLFEARLGGLFDATLLVACRPAEQLKRVVRRDGLSAADARRRVAAQWPLARKRRLADLTLDNDGTLADLRAKTRAVHAGLALLYGGTPNGNQDH